MRSFLTLLVVLTGCSVARGGTVDGRALYTANCQICHGVRGDGRGSAGIALKPKPTDFTKATWWANETTATISGAIRNGVAGTSMKGSTTLKDDEIAALAAYLATFKAP